MIVSKGSYNLMIPDWDQIYIREAQNKDVVEDFTTGLEKKIIVDFILKNPSGKMIDVGANMGYWSLYMSSHYEVFSFEPETNNFMCLKHNTENYKKAYPIHINNCALSDKERKISTFKHTSGDNCGMVAIKDDVNSQLPAITLDSLNLDNIKIIKIDTEGHGLYVLDGALQTLKNNSPLISIETNNLERVIYGLPDRSVENKLDELGYKRVFNPDDDPGRTSNSIFIKN